ncbi:MAG: hypothetical protein K8J31_29320, partial [Anaerolineae bacterium]|nr:hypothetical protein [Anaerolineae bacterium]
MAANSFAPSFVVEINGTGLTADISKYIQQVSVVSERNSMDHFTLSVANPYPGMRWTHNAEDAKLFSIGNSVNISMGYVGEEQSMIAGEITQINARFPSSGAPTLDVQGHSRLHRLTRYRRSRAFREVSEKDIVETIAVDHGLTADIEESTATATIHPDIQQNNQTDLELLLERARQINYEICVNDRMLVFRVVHNSGSPVAVLEWGKNLLNFTPNMNARGQVSTVTVRGYDPMAKREIIGRFMSQGG